MVQCCLPVKEVENGYQKMLVKFKCTWELEKMGN